MREEIWGCKCYNPKHTKEATLAAGCPVTDVYTMVAVHHIDKGIVTLDCPWCGYSREVNIKALPLRVETMLSSKIFINKGEIK